MGISIFPSTAAEFVSNNFVVDMNDTTNNSVTLTSTKQAGTYNITLESGDTSFDIYFVDADGASVGYTNSTSATINDTFDTVVILGVSTTEIITFAYAGAVFDATGEGDEPGAGAYLTSITPADLPSIDDTATVIGGNFGTATEISFTSGTVELAAKNVTITNGTSLIVTRPDGLIEDDAPYDLKAINTGVTPPTGTNAHILAGTVTAGSDPTWVTTSPLNPAALGTAFSQTLEATDDGVVTYAVTAGTITPGLSLNSSTGEISGTPTTGGNYVFTVTASDDGGNTTDRQFEQAAGSGVSGGSTFSSGGFEYNLFTSSDDLIVFESTSLEYLIVAGGGGGGTGTTSTGGFANFKAAGGGGGGGLISGTATISPQVSPVVIGAGGAGSSNGSDSSVSFFGTAIGGGAGGDFLSNGNNGGSGGGAGAANRSGGSGTVGQGFDGADSTGSNAAAGGGGAGEAGSTVQVDSGGPGGDGSNAFSTWATVVGLVFDGGFFAGGGGGGTQEQSPGAGGSGGGGAGGDVGFAGENGESNSGGGAGGNAASIVGGASGGSGVVIVRYAS